PTLNAMIACQERLLAMAGNVQSHGEINCERADEITAEP
ncbi:rRNA maturation RNase YbeY, partial [Pseudomonas sp. HMWF031]